MTISASNKFGEGPHSNPFMIGNYHKIVYNNNYYDSFFAECTNNFVRAEYREADSISVISCIFLNPSDTSEKTCCVNHGRCDEKVPESVQECKTDPPYSIPLKILSVSASQRYCYIVTASNDIHTVKVEGTFTLGIANNKNDVIK